MQCGGLGRLGRGGDGGYLRRKLGRYPKGFRSSRVSRLSVVLLPTLQSFIWYWVAMAAQQIATKLSSLLPNKCMGQEFRKGLAG